MAEAQNACRSGRTNGSAPRTTARRLRPHEIALAVSRSRSISGNPASPNGPPCPWSSCIHTPGPESSCTRTPWPEHSCTRKRASRVSMAQAQTWHPSGLFPSRLSLPCSSWRIGRQANCIGSCRSGSRPIERWHSYRSVRPGAPSQRRRKSWAGESSSSVPSGWFAWSRFPSVTLAVCAPIGINPKWGWGHSQLYR